MRRLLLRGTTPPASHIGSFGTEATAANSYTFSWPAGTAVGDVAMVFIDALEGATTPTLDGGGWHTIASTWTEFGYRRVLFWKVLASGDLGSHTLGFSADSGFSDASIGIGIYRGATTVTAKADTQSADTASGLTLAGFVKSAAPRLVVSYVCDRSGVKSNFTPPAGFTQRFGPLWTQFFTNGLCDLRPSSYVNNANVAWTTFDTAAPQRGWLLELT